MTELSLNSRPARPAGYRVHGTGESTTVVVIGPPEAAFQLNDTALALWELCDGRTTVAEMVGAASVLFAERPAALARDVLVALEELQRDGLIVDTDG
jgi:hypothetical protein